MSYYLFAISNHKELAVYKGSISFVNKNGDIAAVFVPDNKRKSIVYCNEKEGVLYHGSLWYEIKNEKDLNLYKEKAKKIFLDHIDTKISYYSKLVKENEKLREAVENG